MKREYPVIAVVLPVGKRVFWGVMQLAETQMEMKEVILGESFGKFDADRALMVLSDIDDRYDLDAVIFPDLPRGRVIRKDLLEAGYCFALCQWERLPLYADYQSDYFKLMALFANIKATMRNTAMSWFDDLVGTYGHKI
ncbi:hypothetical protein P3551_22955 [Vibrio parahaemolyticus]|nr:hypothetical protein [Vibrio parahaemolyticus]